MNILVVIGKGKSLLYCSPCRTVTLSHVILWNRGFSLGFYILVVKILKATKLDHFGACSFIILMAAKFYG